MKRNFAVAGVDRLWLTDITEHPTKEGKLYCAAVMDAYSRRIIGWSIADHMRTDLVIDALGMATLRRRPDKDATILHSDHGTQYTSWAFGQRLRAAGLLPSMGTVGDCYDNSMMESFWNTLHLEVLDTRTWETRAELAKRHLRVGRMLVQSEKAALQYRNAQPGRVCSAPPTPNVHTG